MKPIFRIVNYVFKKRNISFSEDINSFFKDGVSFPKFVALSLNIDEIPQIIRNPKSINQKEQNNMISLQYLFQKYPEFAKKSPKFSNDQDKVNLLKLILSDIYFNIDYNEILDKCNKILQPVGITFNNIDELIDQKTLVALISVLSTDIFNIDSETNDFDQQIFNYFQIAKVPLVIDESTLVSKDKSIFLMQILIIFDIYSEKISYYKPSQESIQKVQEIIRRFEELLHKKDISSTESSEGNNGIDDDDDDKSDIDEIGKSDSKPIEHISNGLLKVLNTIGKSDDLHFHNFSQTVTRKNLIKFVQIIVKDEEIQEIAT